MRIWIVWAISVPCAAFISFALAADLPSDPMGASPQLAALFDRPTRPPNVILPPKDGSAGVVRCFDYPTFRVKELDYGDHGDDAISVTRAPSGGRPACGKQDDPGEIVLKDGQSSVFEGAKGEFLYIESTMAADTGVFWIYDARTGRAIYQDMAYSDDEPKAISVDGDALTLTYTRGVAAACSLLSDGQGCWAKTIRAAHLSAAIATQPPPVARCRKNYAADTGIKPEEWATDPSVISYDVTVRIERGRPSSVLSRSELDCKAAS